MITPHVLLVPLAPVTPRRRRAGGRFRKYGLLRVLATAPAVCGGLGLMLVLSGGLGQWAGPALLLWFSVPALVLTRRGERLAVRVVLRFRRPDSRQQELLGPVWRAVLDRCQLTADDVDWYVQPGPQPNVCAAGRRSVAVTEGALRTFMAGRVSERQMQALLAHELGHHATSATRYGLAAAYLAAPGRLAFRLVLGASVALSGARRLGGLASVLLPAGVTIALVQAVQQRQWTPAAVLLGVNAALVATPLLAAAVRRASEHAADRFAADVGLAGDLSAALAALSRPRPSPRGVQRLLDSHPSLMSRTRRLAMHG